MSRRTKIALCLFTGLLSTVVLAGWTHGVVGGGGSNNLISGAGEFLKSGSGDQLVQ